MHFEFACFAKSRLSRVGLRTLCPSKTTTAATQCRRLDRNLDRTQACILPFYSDRHPAQCEEPPPLVLAYGDASMRFLFCSHRSYHHGGQIGLKAFAAPFRTETAAEHPAEGSFGQCQGKVVQS